MSSVSSNELSWHSTPRRAMPRSSSMLSMILSQSKDASRRKSPASPEARRSGQLILTVLSISAVIGAVLVAWLYVARSVARRLGFLSEAMRRIADGDLNVDLPDNRSDEIADMGRALLFFRQATADAAGARRKESERTRTLESRRQIGRASW